jgi:hypothetical protein
MFVARGDSGVDHSNGDGADPFGDRGGGDHGTMYGDNGTNSVMVEDSARCELDHIAIIDKPFDWAFHLDMNYDLFDLIIGNFCSSGTIDLLLILL